MADRPRRDGKEGDLEPCGTWAAAMRHYREGGTPAVRACPPCSAEWTRHDTERKRQRRRRNKEEP